MRCTCGAQQHPPQQVALTHWAGRAAATVVLAPRRTLASTETKLGKPPKGVDYVGALRRI